jgi:kynureninase
MNNQKLLEPWLRGTLGDVDPVQRAVLHALELAKEDLEKWCGDLSDEELNAGPGAVAPVAFHLRHIARSTDRLLSYAEKKSLTAEQLAAMNQELEPGATSRVLFAELNVALELAGARIRAFFPSTLS